MKRLFLLPLALLLALGLRAETIDLPEYGRLSFPLDPAAWKIATAAVGDGTFEVMISPRGTTNAYAGFTISLGLRIGMTSRERMAPALVADSQDEAAGSVERRAVPREFAVKKGFGFTADFTDRALVGKPPKRGDFKVQTKVMLALEDKVSVSGSIASDGFGEPVHQQLLAVFQGMELLAPVAVPAKK